VADVLDEPGALRRGRFHLSEQAKQRGGAVVSYSVSPSLPSGLDLSPTTGTITGTPGTVASTAVYTVIASNAAGSATVA